MPLAHGIDLVEVPRITRLIAEHGQRFLDRCFTAGEQAYAAASAKRRDEHLAARFAAKEAVLKALGTGWRDGICWTDIEVIRQPSGAPEVKLSGQAARIADELGLRCWRLSMSHTENLAMASVVAQMRNAE